MGGPQPDQISFGVATLKLESEKVVTAGSTLKASTKLLDRLRGIGQGQEEGYESRTIMVFANGMYSKLREELEDDGVLLFGYIFMAYLDIGTDIIAIWYKSVYSDFQ